MAKVVEMARVIAGPEDVTPEVLTEVLREAGMLVRGEVVSVGVGANSAYNSRVSHLELGYSGDVSGDAPVRVLLKRNLDADWAVRGNALEVAFYRLVAPLADELPMLLRAYSAAHDPASGKSHLLLPDLSETHEIPVGVAQAMALDGVPSEAQLAGIVDAIAAFHAFWWEHPTLGQEVLPLSGLHGDRAAFDGYVAEIEANWATFIAAEGAEFPGELRALYEGALPKLAGLWERYLAGRVPERRNVTVGHGDCYFAAFLCPREADGQTYIIDWQGPSVELAARDLNFLFANFWTSAQRREGDREVRLLRRYHGALLAGGVTRYGWEDLIEDYRLMLIFRIFLPVWDATNGSPQRYWWPKLSCLTEAYRDWRCEELL